jgi:hypothetical protein
MREIKSKKRFFRARPDGITHHNGNRIWYLMEFKHTSDVLPDYLERKDSMASKQYENFMKGSETLQLAIDTRQALGYTSLMPQVNYTEGTTPDNPSRPDRSLLQTPSRPLPKRPAPDHSEQLPHPTTGPRSPKKARTEAPRPLDRIPQTHSSHNPTYNEAPHTRKRPPEDNPLSTSKKQKTVDTSGNGE